MIRLRKATPTMPTTPVMAGPQTGPSEPDPAPGAPSPRPPAVPRRLPALAAAAAAGVAGLVLTGLAPRRAEAEYQPGGPYDAVDRHLRVEGSLIVNEYIG